MFSIILKLLPVIAYMIISFLGTVAISSFHVLIVFEAAPPERMISHVAFYVKLELYLMDPTV